MDFISSMIVDRNITMNCSNNVDDKNASQTNELEMKESVDNENSNNDEDGEVINPLVRKQVQTDGYNDDDVHVHDDKVRCTDHDDDEQEMRLDYELLFLRNTLSSYTKTLQMLHKVRDDLKYGINMMQNEGVTSNNETTQQRTHRKSVHEVIDQLHQASQGIRNALQELQSELLSD